MTTRRKAFISAAALPLLACVPNVIDAPTLPRRGWRYLIGGRHAASGVKPDPFMITPSMKYDLATPHEAQEYMAGYRAGLRNPDQFDVTPGYREAIRRERSPDATERKHQLAIMGEERYTIWSQGFIDS